MGHKKISRSATSGFSAFDVIRYYVLLAIVKTLSHIPFRALYVLSDALFYPFYFIIRYRRKIVRKNLTESFPDKSHDEIVRIEKKFYHFFVDMFLETCKLVSISPREMKRHMKFTNAELANDLIHRGKSASFFLGHYGNWEWISSIGLWLSDDAIKAQIYHKLSNRTMDRLMKILRERAGVTCVEMHRTVRFMADAAREGRPCLIGFIADQAPRRKDAKYFIPFLNHDTAVLTGTEKATKHYGYEALFISTKRVKRGYYECELTPLHDNPGTLPNFELTDLYYQRLELEIRRCPEMYLWTHNRFRAYRRPQ